MKVLILALFFIVNIFAQDLITEEIIKKAEQKYGKFAKNRFEAIHNDLLDKLKDKSPQIQLNTVNTWFNYIKYASDQSVYGVSDYWATLYEFAGKGKGDCEDYTIAKYYTLKELGFDISKLKFTYCIYKDTRGQNISHMVLSYFTVPKPKYKSEILVLDNNNKKILPASKRPDIVKVIRFMNGDTGAKSKKWKQLEQNMKRKKL